MARPTRRLHGTAILLPALLLSTPATAAWDTQTQLNFLIEGDDNPRLISDDQRQDSDSRGILDARLRADSFGERGEIRVEPRVRLRTYADSANADLEQEDLYLRSHGDYAWPNVEVGYRADLSRRSLRDAELVEARPEDPDAETPDGIETGEFALLTQEVDRNVLSPYIDFRLSERTTLAVQGTFSDIAYSGQSELRSDFTDSRLAVGLERRVDQRNQVSANFFVSKFESRRNFNTTDTVGVEGAFRRPLSPTLTFDLTVGLERSDFSYLEDMLPVDNADTSLTINAGFRNRAPRTTMNFDIGRHVYPNGAGFIVNRDELRLFVDRRFSERLSGDIGFRIFRQRAVGDVASRIDRDYGRLELGLEWAWTQSWSLTTGYTYTDQEFINRIEGPVSGSVIYFGIGYTSLTRRGQ